MGGSSDRSVRSHVMASNFILVHHFLEEVGSLTGAWLAHALAAHFFVDPVEIVHDARINAGKRFSGATFGEVRMYRLKFDIKIPLPRPHDTTPTISIDPVGPSDTIGPPESPWQLINEIRRKLQICQSAR